MNFLVLLIALGSASTIAGSEQRCIYDLNEIKDGLNKSGNVNSFAVNCLGQGLMQNGTYSAESISISVFSDDGSGRYDFECVGAGTTLIPTISNSVASVSNLVCSSCNFTADDPCETSEWLYSDCCVS